MKQMYWNLEISSILNFIRLNLETGSTLLRRNFIGMWPWRVSGQFLNCTDGGAFWPENTARSKCKDTKENGIFREQTTFHTRMAVYCRIRVTLGPKATHVDWSRLSFLCWILRRIFWLYSVHCRGLHFFLIRRSTKNKINITLEFVKNANSWAHPSLNQHV